MNRTRTSILVLVIVLATYVSAAAQSTIHVPAEQATIQAGINAASNGDTVLVAPGTYHEHLDFVGKAITVASANGPATTIIDGDLTGTVVRFHTSETNASVLQGFTIMRGKNGAITYDGGGIEITYASPTITGNIIKDNQACDGIGIYSSGGSPIIQNNTISNNRQTGCSGGTGGGGISLYSSGNNAQVIGNTITGNYHSSWGGGMSIAYGGTPTIQSNIISKNSANDGGGIVIFNGAIPRMIQNLITDNVGGGVYWLAPYGTNPIVLLNNTIANNDRANASALFASGWDSVAAVTNNLLVAKDGQTAVYCDTNYDPGPPLMSFNNVFSNGGATYAGTCGNLTGTNSNVSVDPVFANPGVGNYHLSKDSPALDAANGTVGSLPATDLDGNPRTVDGGTGTAKLDMGAYEYQGITTMNVSPTSLTFDSQKTGTTSLAQTVTVKNTGSKALHLKAAQMGADFTQTNTCELPDGIAPNATCAYAVAFVPTTAGDKVESLVIAGANVADPSNVSLDGTGSAPVVSMSSTSLDFGTQTMYTTSASQTVTLTNVGDADLVVAGISISGSIEYGQTNNCSTVVPHASCTISATFTPIATRTRAAVITIIDDAVGSPRIVSLTGEGVGPEIMFSSTSLDFTPQAVGTLSNPLTLTVTNTSSLSLTIGQISISGDYQQTNNCPATLVANASCQVTVTFKPQLYGSRPGTLMFTDNAAFSPQTVRLTGTGTAPLVSVSPLLVSFPGQYVVGSSSSPMYVTYVNQGNDALVVGNISVSGDFSQVNQCPQYVLPQHGCVIQVSFIPTAGGTRTGTLTITDNAYGSPRTVSLQGTALAAYPTPIVTYISPEGVKAGATGTVLTVTGTGFFGTSKIYWDAQALTTTYVTSTSLNATVDSSLASGYGEHKITVVNPAPGGGQSNAMTITVFLSVPLSARDLVFDPYRRVFYASIAGIATNYPNTVVTLDPTTGAIVGTPIAIGSDPSALAISDDGQFLYVGLNGSSSIKRLNLYTNEVDLTIPLGSDGFFGAYTVLNLAVVPDAPHTVVASLGYTGVSPYEAGVKVFDDGVARPSNPANYDIDSIVFGNDATFFFGATGGLSPPTLYRLKLDASGISVLKQQWNSIGSPFATDGVRLYSYNVAVDPNTLNQVGTFSFVNSWVPAVFPERGTNRVYLLEAVSDGTGATTQVWAADKTTFGQLGHLKISIPNGGLGKLQRWGSDGLAFRFFGGSAYGTTSDQIVFIRSSIVNPPAANKTATLTTLVPSVAPVGSRDVLMHVFGSDFLPGAVVKLNGAERSTTFVNANELRAAISAGDMALAGKANITVVNAGIAETSNALEFAVVALSLSTSSMDFGTALNNSTTLSQTVTVRNITTGTITISNVTTAGDFLQVNSCGALAAAASCEVRVSFRPSSLGSRTGTLTIYSDAPGLPPAMPLSGIGSEMTVVVTRPGRPGRNEPTGSSAAVQASVPSSTPAVIASEPSSTPVVTAEASAPAAVATTNAKASVSIRVTPINAVPSRPEDIAVASSAPSTVAASGAPPTKLEVKATTTTESTAVVSKAVESNSSNVSLPIRWLFEMGLYRVNPLVTEFSFFAISSNAASNEDETNQAAEPARLNRNEHKPKRQSDHGDSPTTN